MIEDSRSLKKEYKDSLNLLKSKKNLKLTKLTSSHDSN